MRSSTSILSLLTMFFVSGALQASECVVLLHGLVRSASSMERMQEALADEGFETINIEYPSRDYPIDELATLAVDAGLAGCRANDDVTRVHFVTHSLGGILVRQYLSQKEIADLGRVVMLAPPNQGSAAVDRLRDVPGFDWLNGPAGRQLGKGEDSVPLKLGPANFEVGVIAGNRSIDPLTSAVLPNPDDGRVSVEDTKLEGMADFVIVEHSHAFMMRMRETISLTVHFLRDGRFGSDPPDAGQPAAN
ncbi:MAG: alpha/beta fold hydrolase [Gammaproteobacteria bacterium]|nr:alpha/beta fold hydrolase [Gammaproteobacteria bacterium]